MLWDVRYALRMVALRPVTAIGPEPSDVVMMIVADCLRVAATAVVIGLPLALAASFAVNPAPDNAPRLREVVNS